jgi:uncharacterized protein YidB (DUF937 family)
MGLLDILNGMQNGPGGARPGAPAQSGGGMSPMMMALLGLLAYKAIKGGGLENMLRGATGGGQPQAPVNPDAGGSAGGGLGDILGGLLGGGSAAGRPSGGGGLGDILGGAAGGGLGGILGGLLGGNAGGALNGGLRKLAEDMEQNGQGGTVQSWVGNGPNKAISPTDLASALGADDIDAVAKQTGMPRDQLLAQLSQHLPELVNQMTPDGRLPSDHEANSRW